MVILWKMICTMRELGLDSSLELEEGIKTETSFKIRMIKKRVLYKEYRNLSSPL